MEPAAQEVHALSLEAACAGEKDPAAQAKQFVEVVEAGVGE